MDFSSDSTQQMYCCCLECFSPCTHPGSTLSPISLFSFHSPAVHLSLALLFVLLIRSWCSLSLSLLPLSRLSSFVGFTLFVSLLSPVLSLAVLLVAIIAFFWFQQWFTAFAYPKAVIYWFIVKTRHKPHPKLRSKKIV